MEILADWDRSKDHRYVETKAFKALKSVVEEMHWATLLGKPGDGKSATAAHLLLQYTAREYEPVFLSSPSDWKMLISASPSSRQIAVVDDMFGQSYLDDNGFVKEWKSSVDNMSKIVKQRNGNLLVICTSRRYIFKDIETSLGKFPCFSKHTIVDMTDDQYKLSGDEKVAIFKKFAEAFSIETNTWLERGIRNVDPPHGFPHCAELYCSNAFLQQEGIFFFKNPVQYVQREICNFRDNDRVKFLVLLLVLHNGDKLGLDTLDELIENTTDDDKKFFQTAGVSLETAIPDIHKAVTGLTNTYLRLNNDGSYSFSHHSLRETVAHIYISANPTHAIRALEFQHIVAFTLTQKETAKGTVSKRSLPFKPLAKRMITEIKDGHVSTVCDWEVWSDQTFVINFVKSIENEPLDFLEEMICSKRTATRVTESNSFLKSLIQRKRYIAAESFLKNKSIGKTLQNSDLWVKCLQKGLETAGYASYGINPNIAMIRSLVSIRFGENMQKLDGSIVLSDMLYYSNAEIADVLLDHTYINPQNSQYFHSLANSQIDLPQFKVLCKKLRQAGVDINQIDRMDVPAVFKCLTRFEDNVLDRLLCMVNNGANIHKQCKNGNIVLCTVRTMPSPPCINILTKLSDLDVNFHCTDSTGSNVLHIMCERRPDEGSRALLDYLLNKGAAAGAVNDRGVVPLMLALKNNFSIDVIKTLSKSNPPNHVDKAGQGYFHYLLSSPRITNADEFCDKCEILLKLGSSINGIDNLEKPPLVHLMEQQFYKSYQPHTFHRLDTKYDFVKMFKFLYEHGMDLHVKDSCGRNIVLCVLDWKITEDVLPLLHYLHSIERLDFKLIDDNERNALHHLFANVFYNDVVLEAQEYYEVTEREFPEVSGNMLKEIYDFVTLISPKIKTTFIRVFILNGRKN